MMINSKGMLHAVTWTFPFSSFSGINLPAKCHNSYNIDKKLKEKNWKNRKWRKP